MKYEGKTAVLLCCIKAKLLWYKEIKKQIKRWAPGHIQMYQAVYAGSIVQGRSGRNSACFATKRPRKPYTEGATYYRYTGLGKGLGKRPIAKEPPKPLIDRYNTFITLRLLNIKVLLVVIRLSYPLYRQNEYEQGYRISPPASQDDQPAKRCQIADDPAKGRIIITAPTPRHVNAGLLPAYSQATATYYYKDYSEEASSALSTRLIRGLQLRPGCMTRWRHTIGISLAYCGASRTDYYVAIVGRCHMASGAIRGRRERMYIAYGAWPPLLGGQAFVLSLSRVICSVRN